MLPALVLLVGLPVGAAIVSGVRGSSSSASAATGPTERDGSKVVVAHPSEPLLPVSTPSAYEVVYRVVDSPRAGQPVTTSTDDIRVRRPFDSRIDSRAGKPPGGTETGNRASTLTRLFTKTPGTGWRAFQIGPTIATGDLRFRPALEEAIGRHIVAVRERRRVAGRTCQVYRAGSTIRSGILTPYDAASTEYADFCVDRAGLLLEEVWVRGGRRIQRRVATTVREAAPADDALYAPAGARLLTAAEGGGLARRVDPTSGPPGTSFTLTNPPEGFAYVGRFAVALVQGQVDPRTVGGATPTTSSVVDVWTKGADVLVLEQGASTTPLNELSAPRRVDLGAVGSGEVDVDLRGNELRLDRPGGDFVRLYGTIGTEDLVVIARSLGTTEGTGLTFLDG